MGKPPANSDDDMAALPPGLDLLWGRRERGRRGPKPGLTVETIVAAAIRIADASGLEAVSMAHVATELGFTTMSLYRYVTSKDELLALMWNASAQGAESLILPGEDWRSKLKAWAVAQREMLDQHRWITQMPMASPPLGPNSLTFVELALQALDDTGLADADKLRLIGLVSSYALSEARMAHDAARAAEQAAADGIATPASWEAVLRQLVTEQTYPRLHRIAWAADVGDNSSEASEAEEFAYGLDRILDGIQSLINQTTSKP